METFLFLFEMLGTIAFAASGAVLGVRKGLDVFGVCFLGLTTACGGGPGAVRKRSVIANQRARWCGNPCPCLPPRGRCPPQRADEGHLPLPMGEVPLEGAERAFFTLSVTS